MLDWNGGVAQLGEHLPCKQGVKSSNLSVSIIGKWNIVYREMYFENFIQNDKMIKYLFDQDIVITVKFFNELKEKLSTLW